MVFARFSPKNLTPSAMDEVKLLPRLQKKKNLEISLSTQRTKATSNLGDKLRKLEPYIISFET
jgi:hypothetical protein